MTASLPVDTEKENEDDTPKPKQCRGRHACRFGKLLILLILIIAIALLAVGYFKLAKNNNALKQTIADLKSSADNNQRDILSIQNNLQNVSTVLAKSQQISEQQEKLMQEFRAAQKGDLNNWQVAEAEYLVHMANNQLKFVGNPKLALTLLQQSDSVLQNVQNAEPLRKAVAINIAKIQSLPSLLDTESLYIRLNALDSAVNDLPLKEYPLNSSSHPTNTAPLPQQMPWWKAGFERTWQALSQLVVVRNMSDTTLPLVLPDEKVFLYQNLHAQFANATWGVLYHDPAVYENSLGRINAWITQYFNVEADATKMMLQNLAELQKINLGAPSTIDLNDTIAVFDQYFNKKTQAG